MTMIIGGTNPAVTFPDATVQNTSAIVGGYVPYANLPAGSVLQVVNASYSTQVSNNTSTYADTNLTATITPRFSTSKILVMIDQAGCGKENGSSSSSLLLKLVRNSTDLFQIDGIAGFTLTDTRNFVGSVTCTYLDSPLTTSATTYKTQFRNSQNTTGVAVQGGANGISTSNITLMEIAG